MFIHLMERKRESKAYNLVSKKTLHDFASIKKITGIRKLEVGSLSELLLKSFWKKLNYLEFEI